VADRISSAPSDGYAFDLIEQPSGESAVPFALLRLISSGGAKIHKPKLLPASVSIFIINSILCIN